MPLINNTGLHIFINLQIKFQFIPALYINDLEDFNKIQTFRFRYMNHHSPLLCPLITMMQILSPSSVETGDLMQLVLHLHPNSSSIGHFASVFRSFVPACRWLAVVPNKSLITNTRVISSS